MYYQKGHAIILLEQSKGDDILSLSGGQLAGGNTTTKRADEDYYATDPQAVLKIIKELTIETGIICTKSFEAILEPCVGEGHIVDGLQLFANYLWEQEFNQSKSNRIPMRGSNTITALDIVDRGYPNTIVTDFLKWQTDKKFGLIITNPPYYCAKDFIEKSMGLLEPDGTICMYLKLQFLEGKNRKYLFDKYPPKYIYVMRNRTPTWKNGNPVNPDTGKKWAETICFAWFVWQKNSKAEPIIRWLD